MKLVEVVLAESVSLAGRETLRLTATEHPSLSPEAYGSVGVRTGRSLYIIPPSSIRWMRFVDDEHDGAPMLTAASSAPPSGPAAPPPPAAPEKARSGPSGGKRGGKL